MSESTDSTVDKCRDVLLDVKRLKKYYPVRKGIIEENRWLCESC